MKQKSTDVRRERNPLNPARGDCRVGNSALLRASDVGRSA